MPKQPVRITCRKWMGDDRYSWAVFVDGRAVYSGLDQHSARYEVTQLRKEKGFK